MEICEGAALPPRNGQRFFNVIAQNGTTPLVAVLLSPRFSGVWTHWKGYQVPCHGPEQCHWCQDGLGQRWSGYIACWHAASQDNRILMLTEGAARQLLPHLDHKEKLRGLMIELRRPPTRKNAPVQLRVIDRKPVEKLYPDFDIWPGLRKLWGINEQAIIAGKKPPTTPADMPADAWIAEPRRNNSRAS